MTSQPRPHRLLDRFDLTGRVIIITGGGGLLGRQHAMAVAQCGGIPVLLDVDRAAAERVAREIREEFDVPARGYEADITSLEALETVRDRIIRAFSRVDALINNAANNPKMEKKAGQGSHWSRLETFPLAVWHADLNVGLTGAFLCCQVFGPLMVERKKGVILNIASDLGVIAPDQRIYRQPGLPPDQQPVKPVTYSVVKAGLIGLTRYLATYWADQGIRANALVPGGVEAGQPEDFVHRLTNLIPLGRMAHQDEYQAAVAFLISDASSYMTGASLVIDGGRTCW